MGYRNLLIGCVADDFTGASDASSFLRRQGLRTVLCTGIPDSLDFSESCDAVVIALKTRSVPAEEAVCASLAAMRRLHALGAKQLYLKYCSTFDSTKHGNIGPVLDAALEEFRLPYTLLCPALPVNGRTVKDGILYVNGVPLSESPMKDHPLNPMWDSEIAILMREQSKYPCHVLTAEELLLGAGYIENRIKEFSAASPHFYIVPDYYEDSHAGLIYSLFKNARLLSGGSGLLGNEHIRAESQAQRKLLPTQASGKTLLLAGSCSKMTLEQLSRYRESGNKMIKIIPMEVLGGRQTAESLWNETNGRDRVMLYSSAPPEALAKIPAEQRHKVSQALEGIMAELALRAVRGGYTQIIVAGGETSGAITESLGFNSYLIGESIAPGVPVMMPLEDSNIRLVLKSGNFGQADFFAHAIEMTTKGSRGM